MEQSNSANARIAKNTALLYVRMFVLMIMSFFTARITLNALGVTDYGINNVVGGLVSMFYILSNSMTTASGRFLTFGLGQGDLAYLKKIFSMTVNAHGIMAVICFIAIETVGVWFLNHKMTIPPDRLIAANWVLQGSAAVFVIGLLSVPYNAVIIAHEKMTAFAYMSIFEASFKLLIVIFLLYSSGDKLILISILTVVQYLIKQAIYWFYCKRNFEECVYVPGWDKALGKQIFSFAGWNLIGSSAQQARNQGVNIVINIFTGPVVNAARGISMQINGIIEHFVDSFMTALNPQIIKYYASGDLTRMHTLIFQGTRLSYYLFMLLSIPIFFEIEQILYIWLGQVPEHTVLFSRLILILTLSGVNAYALSTAQLATGDIKMYQIVLGGLVLLNLPISYFLLRQGVMPEMTVVVAIVISQICMLARLWFLRSSIKLSIRKFFKYVYFNMLEVLFIAALPPAVCYYMLDPGFLRVFVLGLTSLAASVLTIYFVGCNRGERLLVLDYVKKTTRKMMRRK
ncbi:lipopolysaccharide biosynthesis protein [uncultured Alistipes sp.]|uniref:lipopolysaccharide biosynthesis protein n=1 Tax=uncultured Alistipes sp. TaxID=538949 RepID=UPI0032B1A620